MKQWMDKEVQILCFFSNLIHFYFLFTFTIFFLQFSLHVLDRLVQHQENQITCAASGTFPSFVVISCVAVGASLLSRATHEITTNEGKVPEAARVI